MTLVVARVGAWMRVLSEGSGVAGLRVGQGVKLHDNDARWVVTVHGNGAWQQCMVMVHGYGAWSWCMVTVLGHGAW